MNKTSPLAKSIALILGFPVAIFAADIQKANNGTNALNLTTSWQAGVLPGPGDVALWDNLYTVVGAIGTQPQLGADASWLGIRIADVGGTRNLATTMIGIQNTGSTNTLTLGSAGIDMSVATQALRIDSRIALGASQTWTIANANTATSPAGFNNNEDLCFQATAAATAFSLGGNTLTTAGAGQITITSGYTLDGGGVSGGTINVGNNLFLIQGGGNRLTTVNSNVNFNVASGATLHFQSNSGALTSNANITFNGGTVRLFVNNAANAVTLTGTANVAASSTLATTSAGASLGALNFNMNLTGAAPLAITHGSTNANVLVLGGNNSAYSGAIAIGGTASRVVRLNTANSGSASATWTVGTGLTLQTNGVNVSLGTLNGAGTVNTATGTSTISVGAGSFSGNLENGGGMLAVTKVGPGTLLLTGANSYTGATTVNGGTLTTSTAQFGATSVVVADGATFGAQLASAGSTFVADSITSGTTTGATLLLDTVAFGNPTVAGITTTTFTPTAATTLKVSGSALTIGSNLPLLDYSGAIGGVGFAGLSLSLPTRTVGSLIDNLAETRVDFNISAVEQVKWNGNMNGDWDADVDGTGVTGTQNWRTTVNNTPTKYLQGTGGIDTVNFDDSATGTTTVNLTTTLTPAATTVNNDTRTYTFTGPGKLSGLAALVKQGPGRLILANSVAYDHAGGTTISGGTLEFGDGVTNGLGLLPTGAVTNDGTLTLSRPDDFVVTQAIGGFGSIVKNNANTVTFSVAATNAHNYALNAGEVVFSAGGNLSGIISGSGELQSTAGTLQLSGFEQNTNTGLTTVSGGVLQLNKAFGVNAVGGDVVLTGGATLAILSSEQIPDTATLSILGTSADSLVGTVGMETVANVIVNPSVATGQLVMRAGFTVTGLATLQNGVLGVGSGQTATLNAVNMGPGTILRVAGNTGPSTLDIGVGGINATGGEIQLKFNTLDQDTFLNLGGDFTATGNVAITNGGYTGPNPNVINLTDTRTFNIAAGTETTIAPDLGGPAGLIKSGDGTLTFTNLVAATYTDNTTVNAGSLFVHGVLSGSPSVNVNAGMLGGGGSIAGTINVGNGAGIDDATLAPGASIGTLSAANVNFASDAVFALEINTDGIPSTDLLSSTGTVVLGLANATFNPTNLGTAVLSSGETLTFITAASVTGSFAGAPDGTIVPIGASFFEINYTATSVELIATVPEPGSVALLVGASVLLGVSRSRRRSLIE